MYPNLVTYHIHRQEPLPPSDALAYQYILAGNGLFVRAETRFFAVCLPIAVCVVRGLPLLATAFRLKIPRLSGSLLHSILADAGHARRPDGGLNEVFYCVDNAAARREIAWTTRVHGQVLVGNTYRPETIRLDGLGLCSALPSPYVQEPGLLEEESGEETAVTCLVMAQQEAQSLMVNRLVAAVAGHLVTELVLRRQATQLGAYFSLEPLALRGVPLTASNLASCGVAHLERRSEPGALY